MNFTQGERVAIFIDGANLYLTLRILGFDVDFLALRNKFVHPGKLVRAYYYTALPPDGEYSSLKPLTDWLQYNGYTLIKKPVQQFTDSEGNVKIRGDMDMELAIDAMEIAPYIDHMVLFSGDGSYRRLVEAVQRKGVTVTAISTISEQESTIADDLRRQVDEFVDLRSLKSVIGRTSRTPVPEQG